MSPADITSQITECQAEPQKGFLKLQEALVLLSPITSKAEYKKAMRVASACAAMSSLPAIAVRYFEILSRNIEAYEASLCKVEHDSLESLRFLMEDHGMTGSDLGRLLGHRELGSKILNSQRQLNVRHIKVLSEHFCVSPELFF